MLQGDSSSSEAERSWARDVLTFWFSELGPEFWFVTRDDIDEKIRTRFLTLHEEIANNRLALGSEPDELLAAVIVLDQFSRNMFRDSGRAFETDPMARSLAKRIIALGFDSAMKLEERYFAYLPFEHSEDRADQEFAVRQIRMLGNDDWTSYALKHHSIIDQFGRFPHRNPVLGRRSRPEELAFVDISFSRKS
jgi:uncharacterized protein (DUF924 family)